MKTSDIFSYFSQKKNHLDTSFKLILGDNLTETPSLFTVQNKTKYLRHIAAFIYSQQTYGLQYKKIAIPTIGKIYNLFCYWKTVWTCLYIKHLYSRYVYIAFRQNWHVSTEAKLILNIMKTYLYNFDPLKPHFYIVKLGFAGVYIIFLISAQNIDCGYSLEPPHRGGSNEYSQSMF